MHACACAAARVNTEGIIGRRAHSIPRIRQNWARCTRADRTGKAEGGSEGIEHIQEELIVLAQQFANRRLAQAGAVAQVARHLCGIQRVAQHAQALHGRQEPLHLHAPPCPGLAACRWQESDMLILARALGGSPLPDPRTLARCITKGGVVHLEVLEALARVAVEDVGRHGQAALGVLLRQRRGRRVCIAAPGKRGRRLPRAQRVPDRQDGLRALRHGRMLHPAHLRAPAWKCCKEVGARPQPSVAKGRPQALMCHPQWGV